MRLIVQKSKVRISTVVNFVFSYSADRLSTRTLKSVWCVSGTRGVKWNGMVPGVTSEEFLTIFHQNEIYSVIDELVQLSFKCDVIYFFLNLLQH